MVDKQAQCQAILKYGRCDHPSVRPRVIESCARCVGAYGKDRPPYWRCWGVTVVGGRPERAEVTSAKTYLAELFRWLAS